MLLEILGVWAFVIGGLAGASALGPLVLAVFVGLKWRPPVWLWLFGPASVLLAGALGTWSGGANVLGAIAHVDPVQKPVIGAAGYGESVAAIGVGASASGAVLLLSAGLLAIALAASTRPGRFTFGPAVLSFLIAGVTFVGGLVGAFLWYAGPLGFLLAFAGGLAALAGAVGGLRAAPEMSFDADEPSTEPGRIAAGRAGVALLAILAVAALGWGFGWLGESDLYQATAMVDPAQKATLSAATLAAEIGVGRVLLVALIGTILASAIPAAWSSGDLGVGSPARTAIGGIGTMVTLAVGVGVPMGLLSSLSPLVEMAVQSDLTDALGGLELPEPKPRSSDAWATQDALSGGCLLVPSGTGWAFRPAGGACPEKVEGGLVDGVVVAAAGEVPARLVASVRWGDQPVTVPIVVKRERPEIDLEHPLLDAIDYGVVAFQASLPPPPDAPPFPETYIVDTAEGVQIGWIDRPSVAAPAHLAELSQLLDPSRPVVLVPGPSWTVQDLVSWCLDVRSASSSAVCGLRPTASLYVPPEAPSP